MRKVELTPEEREYYARMFGKHLENGALLLVNITGTSKTNMSYRLKVSMAYESEAGGVDVMYLTYWLASELGKNLTDDDELRLNGLGFDRVHDIAYTVAEVLKRYGFSFSLSNLPRFARVF